MHPEDGRPTGVLVVELPEEIKDHCARGAEAEFPNLRDCSSPLDAGLFELLRAGQPAAARALGARYPEKVLQMAQELPSLDLLLAAGPEAHPAMLGALQESAGARRELLETALLDYPAEVVRWFLPKGMPIPANLKGRLAARLLSPEPQRLLRWAVAANSANFREAIVGAKAASGLPSETEMRPRELAFLLAVQEFAPVVELVLPGLNPFIPDSDVIWCHLMAASRMSVCDREPLSARLMQLGQHSDSGVWQLALQLLDGPERPFQARLLDELREPATQLLTLRRPSVLPSMTRSRRKLIQPAVQEVLQQEQASNQPDELILEACMGLVIRA